ncbi:MAG: adenylate/guanylate cyclase domain-containing protein [Desulfobacterales bacterium]|nr:adenylate/guanylate cyclase domain-containing protein [Desulfobacterales bacterium]
MPKTFYTWNVRVVDQLFVLRNGSEHLRPPYDDAIVHVDFNDTSIRELNIHYMKRSHYARIVRNLAKMDVSIQMFDYFFPAPKGEEDDKDFEHAVRESGNLYLGMAFTLSGEGSSPSGRLVKNNSLKLQYLEKTAWPVTVLGDPGDFYKGFNPHLTYPALSNAARGTGYLNIMEDEDGVFRRTALLFRYGDLFYPSFVFRAVCDYLGVPPERIIVTPGKHIVLKGAARPGASEPRDITIPIDRHCDMIINFIGDWKRMTHYNCADIFRASDDRDELEMWAEEMKGRIVFVSDTFTGSSDEGPVPTDDKIQLCAFHANAMNTILTESFLKALSKEQKICVEIALLVIILVLSFKFKPLYFSLGALFVSVSYTCIAAGAFLQLGVILEFVRPLMMVIFATFFVVTHRYLNEEREKRALRKKFEAYFPPTVVKKIMADPTMIASGGQKKELTILFSDIKNFTKYSSKMSPGDVKELLNEYFEAMTEVVFRFEGTVDKFIGDGMMVFFGDPEPQPDHAPRCVEAAVEMQRETKKLRKKWEAEGGMPIQIRIGVNTGPVVVGNMGSSRRLSYTVIGSSVNLAQRLESKAPVDGILISDRTNELLEGKTPTRLVEKVRVKGFEEAIRVHEVVLDF